MREHRLEEPKWWFGRGKLNSLEEAEDRMTQRERVVFSSANPRLAALAARGAARAVIPPQGI